MREPDVVPRLVERFRDELGATLHARSSPELVALDPDPGATAQYGEFALLVFDSPSTARLLVHGEPDADGVHWTEVQNELSDDPPYWAAAKLYGAVLLRWWSGEREVDERWRRLDETLRGAVG